MRSLRKGEQKCKLVILRNEVYGNDVKLIVKQHGLWKKHVSVLIILKSLLTAHIQIL